MTTDNRHFKNTNKDNKRVRDMFCINHSGKMNGMISISTSPLKNERCKARAACQDCNCICTHCYSNAMMDKYDALSVKLAANTDALTSEIIPGYELPEINPGRHPYGRIEAFGDLVNETQVINYLDIIAVNPGVHFAWWTKNPDLIKAALITGEYVIPENVTIIYSNPIIDREIDINKLRQVYPFINKVFTVWSTKEAADAVGRGINCGARHCMSCGLCYEPNNVEYVNELLK